MDSNISSDSVDITFSYIFFNLIFIYNNNNKKKKDATFLIPNKTSG